MTEPYAMLSLPYGEDKAGGGFLTVAFQEFSVTISLKPKQAELVRLLNGALEMDLLLDYKARGWRKRDAVIAKLEYPIQEGTLNRYVSNLNGKFREAVAGVAPGVALPGLISTRRGIGIRLTWPVELFDPGDEALPLSSTR